MFKLLIHAYYLKKIVNVLINAYYFSIPDDCLLFWKCCLYCAKYFYLNLVFTLVIFLWLQYFRRESDPLAQKSHVSPLMTLQMFLYNLHKVINQGILHHAMDLLFFYFVIEMYVVLKVWNIISSHCMKSTHSDLESAGACSFPRFNMKDKHCFESVLMIFMWICALYLTPLLYLYFPPLHQSLNPTSSARL